jgi:branched-chain amino acid transport system substrate-binding protein
MARSSAFAYNLGVALVLLAAASAAQPQGVTTTTIVLGQSAPLSGSNKSLGDDIRNGALAYFKKVNDAGG